MKEAWKECKLGEVCYFAKDKVSVSELNNDIYISTENMIPNRGGITKATNLPTGEQTPSFESGDILVSNIRPYFKKIWKATFSGGCSADVLNFKAKNNIANDFLYYVLSDDEFFKYCMTTSKGTKMPRGDKVAIMQYPITLPPLATQQKIATILSSLDDKIELNNKINDNLEQQAQAIFKSWFVDFEPFGGKMPEGWRMGKLSEIAKLTAGGDKPKETSLLKTESFCFPIFSNGLDNYGLYGYAKNPIILEESITVSGRGTIGFVCLRNEPYVPIVRLISVIPNTTIISAKYLYFVLKNMDISGTGTTQQQLTIPAFSKENVIIPSKNIVEEFTNIIIPMFNKIFDNRLENNDLISLSDTLLPKLMSGEIDVESVTI